MMGNAVHDFTLETLQWRPYIEPVSLENATAEQREALKITPSNTKVSDYVLVLAHDPEILAARTPLFNDIMYGRGGLSRAERELGSLAASVVNHCVTCAAIHANRYITLAKKPEVVEAVYRDGPGAELPAREQAILDFSVKLTESPDGLGPADMQSLKAVGLDDLEILDLIHATAIFGWANRLMHTLGEPYRAD
jgi:uncharacterized peroxidase-related enzyme